MSVSVMQTVAELLRAIAGLVTAFAWPAIVMLALSWFRTPLGRLIDRINSVKLLGFEAQAQVQEQVQKQIDKSAEEAKAGNIREPTPSELARARNVEELARNAPRDFVRQEIERLAAEYEQLRASMPSGNPRTRAMEVVVAKMRTLGRAAWPLRHELVASAAPGMRLQAIAILQVEPDYDLLDWLAERPSSEKPFMAYHAMVALDAAAADSRAAVHAVALGKALKRAKESIVGVPEDTDRNRVLARAIERVSKLHPA